MRTEHTQVEGYFVANDAGQLPGSVALVHSHLRQQPIAHQDAALQEVVDSLFDVDIPRIAVIAADVSPPLPNKVSPDVVRVAAANRCDRAPAVEQCHPIVKQLQDGIATLASALAHEGAETTLGHAEHCCREILPAMLALRSIADELEGEVADDLWPLATYQEMLFIK